MRHEAPIPYRAGTCNASFEKPPVKVPTGSQTDGPLLGNGDVGVVASGASGRLRFSISKNDFWKSKPGYPNGGPRPIGGLDLRFLSFEGASYHMETDLATAELKGCFTKEKIRFEVRAWVAATANLLVIETSGDSLGEAALWGCSGDGSMTTARPDCVSRRFEGDDLVWPCEAGIVLKTVKEGVWVASIVSSFEAINPVDEAARRVEAIDLAALEALREEHRRWWSDFWNESSVEIGDELIERHYYGAQYIMASCSRNPGFPPGLWGNWITTDTPGWAGDYHLNYNHEAPFWGLYSSNHLGVSESYDAPLLDSIEAGRRNAREILNQRGIYMEVGIGPRGFCTALFRDDDIDPDTVEIIELEKGHQFWGQKSNALFGTIPMLLRWHHTLDHDYARRVYPYLIEVVDFWEDYLRFEEGRYVIYNDCYNEAGPWEGPKWREMGDDFNPLISLGILRLLLAGILEISAELGRDDERRPKWRHILDHLSALPLAEKDGQLYPCGSERGLSRGRIDATRLTFHGSVWPASVVGRDTNPEYYRILKREASNWGEEVWVHDVNAFDTVPPGAARLGIDPERILSMIRRKIEVHALPNLWITQGGGGIETCGGITAGINEMLLQSYEGVLRLFPCWPIWRDARFTNLRAWGAFLVSAELKDALVQGVRVVSEKGRPCRIDNPWPGRQLRLIRPGSEPETLSGETLEFATSPMEELRLEPFRN